MARATDPGSHVRAVKGVSVAAKYPVRQASRIVPCRSSGCRNWPAPQSHWQKAAPGFSRERRVEWPVSTVLQTVPPTCFDEFSSSGEYSSSSVESVGELCRGNVRCPHRHRKVIIHDVHVDRSHTSRGSLSDALLNVPRQPFADGGPLLTGHGGGSSNTAADRRRPHTAGTPYASNGAVRLRRGRSCVISVGGFRSGTLGLERPASIISAPGPKPRIDQPQAGATGRPADDSVTWCARSGHRR